MKLSLHCKPFQPYLHLLVGHIPKRVVPFINTRNFIRSSAAELTSEKVTGPISAKALSHAVIAIKVQVAGTVDAHTRQTPASLYKTR